MDEAFGTRGTHLDGIYFTESTIVGAKVLQHIHVEISRQNSTLTEVKKEMARQIKALSGTALMNFTYGQKKHEWWELVFTFKWDTESWHGDGDAVRM